MIHLSCHRLRYFSTILMQIIQGEAVAFVVCVRSGRAFAGDGPALTRAALWLGFSPCEGAGVLSTVSANAQRRYPYFAPGKGYLPPPQQCQPDGKVLRLFRLYCGSARQGLTLGKIQFQCLASNSLGQLRIVLACSC